ncbi:short-chain dehydrogenase [Rhodococcus sp. 06-462-5]|uniref:SDR family NAD(P)-dependent oxidoreductase n=1 Tax=unclassified Rhodococcus (in: high G+C Gram-positive bacteria) TaxID=192944 RepID=UPI000B9B5B2F|nr:MULTISPECIES: SDR family oxidoreductase [unclassified Rhodococcus (in: high G+C Gram-positive bacteria)]OZC73593.1 short-chain dehydrogenase [Rhodococcus sp. 06-462-5]OZE63402.1 short-chain dehydrogenase [Rhodococcus sp. 02-925g]
MMGDRRVAVVTGGAGAIGGAIVAALQNSGHRTVVFDRGGDEDGGIAVDLSSESSARDAASRVLEREGRVDVFVHCAGAFDQAAVADITVDTFRHVQAVNVESTFWLTQEFSPGMAERGFGRIILITSNTVFDPPDPVLLPYITSKAAQIGQMRVLARTLGSSKISVSAVAPGLTDTPGARTVNSDEQFADVVGRQALARPLVPEDTAAAVAFLASDGGEALTGQVLVVDGGNVMN